MLLQGDSTAALPLLQQAARCDPDSQEARELFRVGKSLAAALAAAGRATLTRDFQGCVDLLTDTLQQLQLPPLRLPARAGLTCLLRTRRAEALLRLRRHDECLADCAHALYAQNDCIDAWKWRCGALHAQGNFEAALEDCDALLKDWGAASEEIRGLHARAAFQVRKQKRPDYYALLGVPSVASEPEIKREYRQRAKECHPDRFSAAGYSEEDRGVAESTFKRLGEALEVLGDPSRRKLYDEGYDKEAIEERIQAAERASRRGGHHHH
jgi:DnaJ family protein C protein 7